MEMKGKEVFEMIKNRKLLVEKEVEGHRFRLSYN